METSSNKFNKHSVSKIGLTFHCSNKLFWWSQNIFLIEGQNNFGNKISVLTYSANRAPNPVNLLYKIAVGFDLLQISFPLRIKKTFKQKKIQCSQPNCFPLKKSDLGVRSDEQLVSGSLDPTTNSESKKSDFSRIFQPIMLW